MTLKAKIHVVCSKFIPLFLRNALYVAKLVEETTTVSRLNIPPFRLRVSPKVVHFGCVFSR